MAITLVIALVVFTAGAAVGIILLVSFGIRREEQDFTLTSRALDPVTSSTRRVTGLYVRQRTDAELPQGSRQDVFV